MEERIQAESVGVPPSTRRPASPTCSALTPPPPLGTSGPVAEPRAPTPPPPLLPLAPPQEHSSAECVAPLWLQRTASRPAPQAGRCDPPVRRPAAVACWFFGGGDGLIGLRAQCGGGCAFADRLRGWRAEHVMSAVATLSGHPAPAPTAEGPGPRDSRGTGASAAEHKNADAQSDIKSGGGDGSKRGAGLDF